MSIDSILQAPPARHSAGAVSPANARSKEVTEQVLEYVRTKGGSLQLGKIEQAIGNMPADKLRIFLTGLYIVTSEGGVRVEKICATGVDLRREPPTHAQIVSALKSGGHVLTANVRTALAQLAARSLRRTGESVA